MESELFRGQRVSSWSPQDLNAAAHVDPPRLRRAYYYYFTIIYFLKSSRLFRTPGARWYAALDLNYFSVYAANE